MKKLLTIIGAVALATVANAAAINWQSGTIALPSGTQAGKSAATAYLFIVDQATYNTYAAYTDAATLSDAVYAAYGASTATADATKASTNKGAANLDDGVDRSAGTYYAVVLYTATENSTDYWMGNYASATIESTMDVSVSQLSNYLGGSSANGTTAWSTAAVPEPTSGLLMLLGMAGLALRRRRV